MWAIKKGNLKAVKFLIKHNDIDLNAQDDLGLTPLMHAINSYLVK